VLIVFLKDDGEYFLLGIIDMEIPLVSIIMPVFNAEDTVFSAVESVLLQSWTNFELIVVDDGRTVSI